MHSIGSRYAFALAVSVAALLLRVAVDPWLGEHGPLFASSAAILLAALFGGFGPGVLSLAVGMLAAAFLFIEPRFTFAITDPSRTASMALYAGIGLLFCVVGLLYRRNQSRLRTSHETFKQLVENSPFGVYVVDADFRLAVVSAGAQKVFENVRPLIGRDFAEVLRLIWPDPAAGDFIALFRQTLKTGQPHHSPSTVEKRADIGETEAYDWRTERVRMPDGRYGVVCHFYDLSVRQRLEAVVRESEKHFRAVFEQTAAGIAEVDPTGRFVRINDTYCEMVGRSSEELLQLRMDITHPEDLPANAENFVAMVRGEIDNFLIEKRYVRPDGSAVWVRNYVSGIRDDAGKVQSVIAVVDDITDRKHAEQAVAESEANFRAMAENIPQLAWMTDETGWIFWYNRRWFEYTGTTLEEMQGWGWTNVHHPDHAQRVVEKFRKHISSGESWEDTFPLRSKDGEYRWFLSRAFPIRNEQGEIVRWFGTNTDITELREMDERKDQFLAVLSHELRNPLAAIRMAATMLKHTSDLPSDAENMVSIVSRQTSQLVRLVDDLLDMNRITRGTFELHRQVSDLDSILRRAIEAVDPSKECHAVELAVQKPDEPVLVDADPVRLSQVFANLIGNACKYSEPGSTVDVFIELNNSAAVIRVRDFGVGIPPDRIGQVFEMFAQVDPDRDRRTGGLGIGLALAHGIVQLHGGTIEARSEGEGRGSEFIVTIPLVLSPEPAAAAVSDNGEVSRILESKKPRRILAVDDNLDALKGLAGVLRSAGHDVLTAEDGPAALLLAESHQPEAALLDIGMPGMDGYELAQQIRRTSWGRDLTLIALTGWGQEKDKARAAEAGFNAHLTKPADIESIEQALAAERARAHD